MLFSTEFLFAFIGDFHLGSSVPVGFSRRVDAASRMATAADMSHRKNQIVFLCEGRFQRRREREGKHSDVVVLAE
ncbi:MAG: hypothetical protein QOJ42_5328, partial [Acidobacteriaceae bacterium]|nr:hypothetical protein [Acidobacteriaceae bacterium]